MAVRAHKAIILGVILSISLLGAGSAQLETQGPQPQATLHVSRSQYLSTETAQGSLEIVNSTDSTISYNPIDVVYLIREPDGSQREDRMVKAITILPMSTNIPPGERRSIGIALPGCEVVADPCTERVAIKLTLAVDRSHWYNVVTAETSYKFVADPTATFRVDGLRDNRPLILSLADARGSVPVDALRVEFRVGADAAQSLSDALPEALSNAGFALVDSGELEDRRYVDVAGARSPQAQQKVVEVLAAVAKEKKLPIDVLSQSYVPSGYDGFDKILGIARERADVAAAPLGRLLHAEPIVGAGGLFGDGARFQIALASNNRWVSESEVLDDPTLKAWLRTSQPTAVDVVARAANVYVGANPTTGLPDSFREAVRSTIDPGGLTVDFEPLSIATLIEADRPEIYAVALSRRTVADRLGYDADGMAIDVAQKRIRELAQALGVSTSLVSLVARYPRSNSVHDPIDGVGVAMPMNGERSAAWRVLAAQPTPAPTAAPMLATPHPIPTPGRTSTPGPVVVPWQYTLPGLTLSTAPDLVPIGVPDAATTLSVDAYVINAMSTDAVRVDVIINQDYNAAGYIAPSALPDPYAVAHHMREQALVVKATAELDLPGELPVGYELLVRTHDGKAVQHLLDRLRAYYTRLPVWQRVRVSNVVGDCRAVLASAVQESAREAMDKAISQSRAQGRALRSLVLAIAYPPDTGTACATGDALSPLDIASDSDSVLKMPDNATVSISVPVKLVFRTIASPP